MTAPVVRMLLAQTGAELRTRWRIPAFSLTSLLLPIVFYAFFALPVAHLTRPDGVSVGAFLVASFGAYAVGSVMVNGFGIGVATERAMKLDVLIRVTPLPPAVYLLAKVITALVFGLGCVVALTAFATIVGGVRQPLDVWVAAAGLLLAGSLPFIGLGFAIGYAVGPQSAPAVANLVYLPLSFASGLFVPLEQLPSLVRGLAPYLPTYHYGRLAWHAVGAGTGALWESVGWLGGYTVAFLAIALRAYRRDERLKFS
ncbi:MAG TPA: ABC transporter permease [Terriglobales bacterium]|nr:ABC transporter permease [Terriglobales bacterium]